TRPGPPPATTTGQVGCRCRAAHNGPTAAGAVVESRADLPRAAHPLPGAAGEASGARDHLSGDLRARTWRVAPGTAPRPAHRPGHAPAPARATRDTPRP